MKHNKYNWAFTEYFTLQDFVLQTHAPGNFFNGHPCIFTYCYEFKFFSFSKSGFMHENRVSSNASGIITVDIIVHGTPRIIRNQINDFPRRFITLAVHIAVAILFAYNWRTQAHARRHVHGLAHTSRTVGGVGNITDVVPNRTGNLKRVLVSATRFCLPVCPRVFLFATVDGSRPESTSVAW